MARRNLIQLLLYSILIFFSSCSGDDDNDGTAPGLDDLLSSEYQNKISEYVPLNRGSNPPNIEGTYYMNTPVITFDSGNNKEWWGDDDYVIISIKKQSSANMVSFEQRDFDNDEGLCDRLSSDLGQISGSGSKFTLCFKYLYGEDGNANNTAVYVISGTKTTSGIANLYGGCIVTERNDPDGDSYLRTVGYMSTFEEKDGLASNYSSALASAKVVNMIGEGNSFFKRPLMK